MGNWKSKPYIIDDYDSDDFEDVYSDQLPGGANGSSDLTSMVDAKIVSSLVNEVEELLQHLANQNYQAAYDAAMLLKSGSTGTELSGYSQKIEEYETKKDQDSPKSGTSKTNNKSRLRKPKSVSKTHSTTSQEEAPSPKKDNSETNIEAPSPKKDNSETNTEQELPHVKEVELKNQKNKTVTNSNSDIDYIPEEDLVFDENDLAGNLPSSLQSYDGPTSKEEILNLTRNELKKQNLSASLSNQNISSTSLLDTSTGTSLGMNTDSSGTVEIGLKSPTNQDSDMVWEIDIADISGKKKPSKRQSGIPSLRTSSASKHEESPETQYTPPQVSTSLQEVSQRKIFDTKRWCCVSRPQYKTSCGMSSVVSCWNYLFSSLGQGSLQPITQEEALTIIGFQPPFGDIRFGPFTGNITLMRWFRQLNDHFKVRGKCYYMYKPQGKNRTLGVTSEDALQKLKTGLKDSNSSFVYHCQNHYFCPIGYEDTPLKATQAYSGVLPQDEVTTWVLIGDPSSCHPSIHCKRWSDIATDLNCQNPDYLDMRRLHNGMQKRKTKKVGGNLHSIIIFQKNQTQNQMQKKTQIPRVSGLPVRRSGSGNSPTLGGDTSFSPESRVNGREEAEFNYEDDSEIEEIDSD